MEDVVIKMTIDDAVLLAAMVSATIKTVGVCPGCGTKHVRGTRTTKHAFNCPIGLALDNVACVVPSLVLGDC